MQASLEFTAGELALAERVARCLDRLARLDAICARSQPLLRSDSGTFRVNPAYQEARARDRVLADLVKSLALPAPPESGTGLGSMWRTDVMGRQVFNAPLGNAR